MKLPHSLRLRVAIGMMLIAIIAVVMNGVLMYSMTDDLEVDLINQIIDEELQHYIASFRSDPTTPPPFMQYIRGYFASNEAQRKHIPESLRNIEVGMHEMYISDKEHHVIVRDEPEGRFIISYDVSLHDERELQSILLMLLGSGIIIVAAAGFGNWAASWLVKPVRTLVDQVNRLGMEQPASPLSEEHVVDEVQHLARAFDGYLLKVRGSIQREQEFTGNISHELRTPLTAIRTSCELLSQSDSLSDSERRRVETINRAAERLTETTQSLLYLARGAELPHFAEVSLKECVSESASTTAPLLAHKGIVLTTDIDPAAMVYTDPTALSIVVGNLLRNAAYYTEQGKIDIVYRDGLLIIEDSGPGIDATILPRIRERFYRGANPTSEDGMGLGLAIVERICERFGWQLEIKSTANIGTRASIRFPLPSSQIFHADSIRS